MSYCLRIELQATPAIIPEFHLSDGKFVFDTDESFDVRASKKLEQLEVGQITIENVIGFSLPASPKNNLVLRKFVTPNGIDQNFDPIPVVIIAGSRSLRQTLLYVTGYNPGDQPTYDIEIRTSKDEHWIVGLKDKKFVTVDLGGTITFDEDTVNGYNSTPGYIDGDIGVKFAPAFYGAWSSEKGIHLADLRPQISLLYLLQQLFCSIGWTFRSNILESNYCRQIFTYILDKEFSNDVALIDSRKFNALLTEDVDMFPNGFQSFGVNFDNVISNPGGYYDSTTGKYIGAGVCDMFVKTSFEFHGSSTSILNHNIKQVELHTNLVYSHPVFGTHIIESQTTILSSPEYLDNQTYIINHEFVARNVQIDPGSVLFVVCRYDADFNSNDENDGVIKLLAGAQWWNDPKSIFLQSGDDFLLSNMVRKDITGLDAVKGAAHLISGKFRTNFLKREVWLDCPYRTITPFGEVIDGFFDEDNGSVNIDPLAIANSERAVTPNTEFKRYFQLKFKGEGDAAVKDLKLTEGHELHSALVDYGVKYPEEYDVSENPFFEATLNKGVIGRSVSGDPIDLPWMVETIDDDPPKMAYDIQPRVLFYNGNSTQYYKRADGTYYPVTVNFLGVDTATIPYAFQKAAGNVEGIDNPTPLPSVVYGENEADVRKDLYNMFYKRWVFQTHQNLSISILTLIEKSDYFKIDFRSNYRFSFLGSPVLARLIEINDFSMCSGLLTPLVFLPDKKTYDACLDPITPTTNGCQNNAPQLIIDFDGSCYNFSLGGYSASAIANVVFEWKYEGDTIWTQDFQLCDPTGVFEVRMTVNYVDGCPTLYRRRTVDVCGNSPAIAFDYDYDNNCIRIIPGGVNGSTVEYVDIHYSWDGGITFEPSSYPIGSCLDMTGHENIVVSAQFFYSDNCPDITITDSFELPVTPPLCSGTTADVVCDDSGNLTLTGTIAGVVALDIVLYQAIGATTWSIWDGVSAIAPCPFLYKRVIFYCSDCPAYCSAVHTCDCTVCNVSALLDLNVDTLESTVTGCTSPTYQWYIDRGDGDGFVLLSETGDTLLLTEYGTFKLTVTCADGCTVDAYYDYIEPPCFLPTGSPVNLSICN